MVQLKPSDLLKKAATQAERKAHDELAYSGEMSQAQAIMQSCLKEGSQTAVLNDFLDSSSQAKPQLKDNTKSTSTLFSKKLKEYQTAKANLAKISAEPELAIESEVEEGVRKFADPGTEALQQSESLVQGVRICLRKRAQRSNNQQSSNQG